MRDLHLLWLLLAGFGGGLTGSVAGLASLVSYPALLAVGLTPVSANVTNTVALIFSSVGSVLGFRPELRAQRARARQLLPLAGAGGLAGGLLLLATPAQSFAQVVPVLIGVASLAVVLPRRRPARQGAVPGANTSPGAQCPQVGPSDRPPRLLSAGVFAGAVYGGYFGAAAGVLLLALMLMTTSETVPRCTALRNLLLGLANGVAAVAFAVFGPVHWTAAVPLAAGFLAGGRLGPVVVRKVPAGPLRVLIACAGIGLAVHLGIDAYAPGRS